MKKILTFLAIVIFSLNASAQETKPAPKEEQKVCSKHDSHSKKMTEEEIKACKVKCKAERKKCKFEDMSKCKKADKKCSPEEKAKNKKCCAKKE